MSLHEAQCFKAWVQTKEKDQSRLKCSRIYVQSSVPQEDNSCAHVVMILLFVGKRTREIKTFNSFHPISFSQRCLHGLHLSRDFSYVHHNRNQSCFSNGGKQSHIVNKKTAEQAQADHVSEQKNNKKLEEGRNSDSNSTKFENRLKKNLLPFCIAS